MEKTRAFLAMFRNAGLYPEVKEISGSPTAPTVMIEGREALMFCSNSYLGLADHPAVKKAVREAVDRYGLGSGGSRLISGTADVHRRLEKTIAAFKGCEDAIVFTTGYQANVGTITAFMDGVHRADVSGFNLFRRPDVILSDELNHASIIDGCRLCRQRTVVYRHRDLKHLESLLKKYRKARKLIVTDAVFSMDGDIAPLPGIVRLARGYEATVMIDEAHSTGVLGKTGRGIKEHFHLEGQVEVVMGTLSKALGGLGGYVTGSRELVDFLRISSRSYIFSTAFPPAIAAGVIAAIEEIKKNPGLIDTLWRNVDMLRTGLQKRGFDTLGSETPIIPVHIGEEKKAIETARMLLERRIFAPCVRWPAVAHGSGRIRLTVMANHTPEHIQSLLEAFTEIDKKLTITKNKKNRLPGEK